MEPYRQAESSANGSCSYDTRGKIPAAAKGNDSRRGSTQQKSKAEAIRQKRLKEERARKVAIQKRKQKMLLGGILAITVLGIILLAVNISQMVSAKDQGKTKEKTEVQTEEAVEDVVSDTVNVSELTLDESMYIYENDEDMLQQLKDRLYSSETEDDRLEFIIEHEKAYPPEMIEFLVKYPEVIDFVLKYPIKSREQHSSVVDISQDYTKGTVPTFIQWDDRWGYIEFGDNVIGDSGCGPTCLAMAMVALTGKGQYTPIALCKFATDNNYYVYGSGSSWDLMKSGAEKLGLSSEKINISEESLRLALKEGKVLILSVGPGIFTKGGHFILIYKYEDGKFYVKDPNSRIRTDTGYTFDEIGSQIKGVWALCEEE